MLKNKEVKILILIFDLKDFYNSHKDIKVYFQGKRVLRVK
jgi:hypothetical protein